MRGVEAEPRDAAMLKFTLKGFRCVVLRLCSGTARHSYSIPLNC